MAAAKKAKGADKRGVLGRNRLDDATCRVLVEAFRQKPGNATAAAAAAGVSFRTARKAWRLGLGYPPIERPIQYVVEEEQGIARAQLTKARKARAKARKAAAEVGATPIELTPDEARDARQDVIDSRVAQAQLVRLARENSVGMMKANAHLVRLASHVARQLHEKLTDPERMALTTEESLDVLKAVATITRTSSAAAESCAKMESDLLGSGADLRDDADMTVEQAVKEIQRANDALAMAQRAGLRILPGGKVEMGEDTAEIEDLHITPDD